MARTLTNEIIAAAITGFEAQKAKLDAQLTELRQSLKGGSAATTAPPAPAKPIRKLSAAGRRAIAAAARRRWAAVKAAKAAAAKKAVAKPAPKKTAAKKPTAPIKSA